MAQAFFFLLPAFLFSHSLLCAQSSSGAISAWHPQVFVNEALRYRMASGQTEVGEARISITRDEAQGVIHFVESVSGLFERSTAFTLHSDSTLRPFSSHTVFGREPRFHAVRLQYGETGIAGQIEQPVEYGGIQEIRHHSEGLVHDFFAVPQLLRALALELDETSAFPIFDFRQKRVTSARAWVARKEAVAAPAGHFNCYRVEGFSGKLRWIFWIDENFPHRLVKQVFPAMDIEMELVEFQSNAGAQDEALKSSSLNLQ